MYDRLAVTLAFGYLLSFEKPMHNKTVPVTQVHRRILCGAAVRSSNNVLATLQRNLCSTYAGDI